MSRAVIEQGRDSVAGLNTLRQVVFWLGIVGSFVLFGITMTAAERFRGSASESLIFLSMVYLFGGIFGMVVWNAVMKVVLGGCAAAMESYIKANPTQLTTGYDQTDKGDGVYVKPGKSEAADGSVLGMFKGS